MKTVTKTGDKTTEQVADYEPGVTGALQLARQVVSNSVKDKAGNETREVSIYARSIDGRVQEPGAPQELKEQQSITRTVRPDGSVVEAFSACAARLWPTLASSGVRRSSLGSVCKGNCATP